ncbi:Hypothetical Protein FCC1311_012252 [Hondaea fermentalgiana]|uniref:Alpha/beta hydrolase n=1 Tax=Hondaea fermentalgiana TaxID=2315210 RepID=A0A2R5G5E8_9STRA|nr:Hypothetical Protein FCC1311_012252 [Hondaea fermentalgiana]|eukprot:GBG25008.1 Hypothetical Protein FCC1311_012252 [Hondaea fermentalgiana]
MENRQVENETKVTYVRKPIKIVFEDKTAADERYGGNGDVAILEGELLEPQNVASKSVFVFMHPSGIQNLLPMPVAMARAGLHVITCCSRYPNNDSCLIMEKVAIDLGACVKHAKEKLGYAKVVLCGWSGGGSLSSFYQAQAERPTIQKTPAGDSVDLTAANLPPADGLCILAAHTSRAKIFTEWIDPSVLDESDPSKRDRDLDVFDPANPNQPPYSPEYIARFRQAQIERNRRITRWAKQQLAKLDEATSQGPTDWRRARRDLAFTVHCTQADLRRLDTTIEPNGREATPLDTLAAENHSPVGLARFTTLRSWLSQWSYDDSKADGPLSLTTVECPVLVMANEADHLVPGSHPKAMYDAVRHSRKTFLEIEGATHYYFGQKQLMASAIQRIKTWLRQQDLLESQV